MEEIRKIRENGKGKDKLEMGRKTYRDP